MERRPSGRRKEEKPDEQNIYSEEEQQRKNASKWDGRLGTDRQTAKDIDIWRDRVAALYALWYE